MRMFRFGFLIVAAFAISGPALADDSVALVAHGHQVFEKWCAGCHAAPTKARPLWQLAGTNRLQQIYKGSEPAALEERTDLTTSQIESIVRKGREFMPRTRKTEVSDADLNAIAAYLTRNNKK